MIKFYLNKKQRLTIELIFIKNNDNNIVIIRNDIPDIFWNMVQPYASELNQDDLNYLKEQIESNHNNKIQFNTPGICLDM